MNITLSYFSSYCSKFILFDKEGDCRSEHPWTEKARAVISLQRIHGESTCQSDERFCHWKALDGFADIIHYRGNSLSVCKWKYFSCFLLLRPRSSWIICRSLWILSLCVNVSWHKLKWQERERTKERKKWNQNVEKGVKYDNTVDSLSLVSWY